jgi:hypothetical protein
VRVMVIVKANEQTEAGIVRDQKAFEMMHNFNEQLVQAGIILAGHGLQPTSKGKRVRFEGKRREIIDGPFAETKELIAGFGLWQVRSMDEAVEWVKKAPFDTGAEIEIRPIYEAGDLSEGSTAELQERGRQLREKIAARK